MAINPKQYVRDTLDAVGVSLKKKVIDLEDARRLSLSARERVQQDVEAAEKPMNWSMFNCDFAAIEQKVMAYYSKNPGATVTCPKCHNEVTIGFMTYLGCCIDCAAEYREDKL